jgi:hypothetical protein
MPRHGHPNPAGGTAVLDSFDPKAMAERCSSALWGIPGSNAVLFPAGVLTPSPVRAVTTMVFTPFRFWPEDHRYPINVFHPPKTDPPATSSAGYFSRSLRRVYSSMKADSKPVPISER